MTGVVNYKYPSTSAPTVAQVLNLGMVTAQIVLTDGDTGVTIAHAMQLTTAQLANLWPVISINYSTAPTTTLANPLQVVRTDSSDVTITKVAQTGSGFTAEVVLQRPNSLIT